MISRTRSKLRFRVCLVSILLRVHLLIMRLRCGVLGRYRRAGRASGLVETQDIGLYQSYRRVSAILLEGLHVLL